MVRQTPKCRLYENGQITKLKWYHRHACCILGVYTVSTRLWRYDWQLPPPSPPWNFRLLRLGTLSCWTFFFQNAKYMAVNCLFWENVWTLWAPIIFILDCFKFAAVCLFMSCTQLVRIKPGLQDYPEVAAMSRVSHVCECYTSWQDRHLPKRKQQRTARYDHWVVVVVIVKETAAVVVVLVYWLKKPSTKLLFISLPIVNWFLQFFISAVCGKFVTTLSSAMPNFVSIRSGVLILWGFEF